jgi:hypothetical protein
MVVIVKLTPLLNISQITLDFSVVQFLLYIMSGRTSRRSPREGDRYERVRYRTVRESSVQTDTPVPHERKKRTVVAGTQTNKVVM